MPGHLFITHGAVDAVACDAVLVPDPAPRGSDGVVCLDPGDGIQQPARWAGGGPRTDPAATVRAYVQEAASAARIAPGAPRPLKDPRPLLALPDLQADGANKGRQLLELVRTLIELLQAPDTEADVVLVLDSAEAYAAAQRARDQVPGAWAALQPGLEPAANDLADRARRDELVVFLGAGASIGAGLPSWSELLRALGVRAGLPDDALAALGRLDPRDAGLILTQELGRDALRDAVLALSQADRGSIVHQLVASLPVREAVTTNYDTLFERAWRQTTDEPVNVLPPGPLDLKYRWLLKLHGSVDRPGRIVLSREDYLRLEGEGVALAGIVQALLLTRHMLFVGYSMSDENFHRLVHQVRSAIGPATAGTQTARRFGTAITPRRPTLGDRLWRGQVDFVTTASDTDDDPRQAAILLDRIGALAVAPVAHVLSTDYDALLSADQLELRERLRAVWELTRTPGRLDERTRAAVGEALERIGRPGG